MAVTVVVRVGDCLSSIAFEHGHFWATLWDHPENEVLRSKRGNPHVLCEGDKVFVPDLRIKQVDAQTGRRHTFRRIGVPEKLRLRFGTKALPRVGIAYTLTVEDATGNKKTNDGVTDGAGELSCFLPPNARSAELLLNPVGTPQEHYVIALRELDPITTIRGFLQRLRNLGYFTDPPKVGREHGEFAGQPTGELSAEALLAMRHFQSKMGLSSGAFPDQATQDALLAAHGC